MRRTLLLVIAVGIASCDSAIEPLDRSVEVVRGANQTAGAGASLTEPVVVRVLEAGRPAQSVEVRWRAIEGGGTVSESVTLTDAEGNASVVWTLGAETGQQLLLATSGNASVTILATSIFQVRFVSVGFSHACALSSTGEAFCWGNNAQFRLGNGTEISSVTPVRVSTGVRFAMISAGWSHTCAVSLAGAAFCWGDNSAGQLGLPATVTRAGVPVAVPVSDAFHDVAAGFVHTCGATTAGASLCWGQNAQGQLAVPPATNLQQISAGEFHSCARRNDGTLVCWGWNVNGQLGTNAPLGAIVATPTQTFFDHRYSSVAAGVRHSCAVGTDTRAYCWGRNATGENGQDPGIQLAVPVAVGGQQGFTAVTAGHIHSCGLVGGRAYCWGAGHGKTPVLVSQTLQFTMISAGFDRTCGVAAGEIWCWSEGSLNPERITVQ
ncbi:MAG: RCC1 domain-containing protein [Gemmatimonadota bacterium]